MLLTDHLFTSSMGWYCLRYWICEIGILLLEWNHILFMRYVIWFKNIAEQNVISERQHVCRSLCVLMLHSHLTDCLRLRQHFFWGFSGGTTVPPNVTSTGKSQTGTIRYRGSSSSCWLIGVFWSTVWCCVWQLEFSPEHLWLRLCTKCASVLALAFDE